MFATQGFNVVLGKPLESSVGLRYKTRSTYSYLTATFTGDFKIFILNFLRQICNGKNILVSFKGQANHKVQFYTVPARFEGCAYSVHQIFFGNALVDNVAHFLTACFGSEGQAALAYCLYFFSNVNGEAVDTQGRKAYADTFFFELCDKVVHQRSEAGIIRTAQGNKGHFVVTGVIHQLTSQLLQNFRLTFTHRAIHHTCVTETATTATATENFQHNSIVNNIVERYDGCVREIN